MIKAIKLYHLIKEEEKYLKYPIMLIIMKINWKIFKKEKIKIYQKMDQNKKINLGRQLVEGELFLKQMDLINLKMNKIQEKIMRW